MSSKTVTTTTEYEYDDEGRMIKETRKVVEQDVLNIPTIFEYKNPYPRWAGDIYRPHSFPAVTYNTNTANLKNSTTKVSEGGYL